SQSPQWTQVTLGALGSGASGSSAISAKLFVPAGAPLQASGGALPAPSQVKREGMDPPCWNADDVSVKDAPLSLMLPPASARDVHAPARSTSRASAARRSGNAGGMNWPMETSGHRDLSNQRFA